MKPKLIRFGLAAAGAAACTVFCLTAGIPVFPEGEEVRTPGNIQTKAAEGFSRGTSSAGASSAGTSSADGTAEASPAAAQSPAPGDSFSAAQKAELEELIRAELELYLTAQAVREFRAGEQQSGAGGQQSETGGQQSGAGEQQIGAVLQEVKARSEALEAEGKININTAGEEELMRLRGIGETRAREVIRYRTEHGPFASIEDIMKVSGIKEAAFEQIKDSIFV